MANDDWKSSCDAAGLIHNLDRRRCIFRMLACLAFQDGQFIYLGSFCFSQNWLYISTSHENHGVTLLLHLYIEKKWNWGWIKALWSWWKCLPSTSIRTHERGIVGLERTSRVTESVLCYHPHYLVSSLLHRLFHFSLSMGWWCAQHIAERATNNEIFFH